MVIISFIRGFPIFSCKYVCFSVDLIVMCCEIACNKRGMRLFLFVASVNVRAIGATVGDGRRRARAGTLRVYVQEEI